MSTNEPLPPSSPTSAPRPPAPNKILAKLLDRLFASLVNGPSLNARPHNSRQRVDVAHLSRLDALSPEDVMRQLLGSACGVKLKARVAKPKRNDDDVTEEEESKLTDAERQ